MIQNAALRYYGGKYRLAHWIISHFPPSRCYAEEFMGALGVFLQLKKRKVEVLNDINGEIVNLFRVLRSPSATKELVRILHLTPYSREEWLDCYPYSDDPIEQARRTIILSEMSYNPSDALSRRVGGFRVSSSGSHDLPGMLIARTNNLPAITERLKGVVIENRDAMECAHHYDRATTLHYLDPPYMGDTRRGHSKYPNDMWTEAQHVDMLESVRKLRGMVVLSGYEHPCYDLLDGWVRSEILSNTNSSVKGETKRKEVLWINPQAQKNSSLLKLF